ncbi:EamA-like transporter family protein [Martelella alba]|uniref:EamA-like transporter family protein n=1 Tax=Martelella alba TaxID=2590451 RepID=A0A506UDU6_9HYPH|nr:DMT family transporter [Martelella alba]TPW32603.1 EamA-like transporter family protein [Martelella alba]
MITAISAALTAGLLVGISRQINGRLSLSTSPMIASFFNHIVGFITICLLALVIGGLIPPDISEIPAYAWLGGPVGVIFVAAGSWVIPKIGAVATAVLIIGGQMLTGIVVDMVSGINEFSPLRDIGLLLILGGILLAQRRT